MREEKKQSTGIIIILSSQYHGWKVVLPPDTRNTAVPLPTMMLLCTALCGRTSTRRRDKKRGGRMLVLCCYLQQLAALPRRPDREPTADNKHNLKTNSNQPLGLHQRLGERRKKCSESPKHVSPTDHSIKSMSSAGCFRGQTPASKGAWPS